MAINLRWSGKEAENAIERVGAHVICMEAGMLPTFGHVLHKPDRQVIIMTTSSVAPGSDRPSAAEWPSASAGGWLFADDIFARAAAGPLALRTADRGAAVICFTSGTSGAPKGVLISHTALHTQVS